MHYAPSQSKCLLHHRASYRLGMDNVAAGRRLKEARAKVFPTIAEAAKAFELAYATYRQHESGERGFKLEAERYARRLRTTPEWLLFGRQDERSVRNGDAVRVPIVSWVSAGQLMEAGEIVPEDDEWVHTSGLRGSRYFATRVKGDSMDRYSPENSVIIVDAEDRDPRPGKAYVFSVDGQTTYKIYEDEPVIRLEPHSTNPFNKPIFPKDLRRLVVIGRVVRSMLDIG